MNEFVRDLITYFMFTCDMEKAASENDRVTFTALVDSRKILTKRILETLLIRAEIRENKCADTLN